MSNDTRGWFHCGRCGRLFQAALGAGPRTCGNCGADPAVPAEPVANLVQAPVNPEIRARRIEAEGQSSSKKRKGRMRRRNMMVLKLCLGWLVFLFAVVFFGQRMWREEERPGARSEAAAIKPGIFAEEDTAILSEAIPLISKTFGAFLGAGDPAARAQFVRNPQETAGKMSRFYQVNTLPTFGPGDLRLISNQVLRVDGEVAVATTWSTPAGLQIEAVFFKDGAEWRLDWEHFVRYSDFVWPLFMTGQGSDGGEFRLLARRRLSDEKGSAPLLSVVFYSPRFGKQLEVGTASPEFVIERDSEAGRMLAAAFQDVEKGHRPFAGDKALPDPDGMVRVRVKVKRIDDEKGRRFEIEKVTACHWLAVGNPGVVPLTGAEAAAKEGVQAPKRAD